MLPILVSLAVTALKVGEKVPDVAAPNQDGKLVRLSELRGKRVLLYFYPKDDTPGCTLEACSFRDDIGRLTELGVVVLGISRQDAKSHQAFREKHALNFDLLTDADGSIAEKLGIGRIPLIGLHKRQSLLIDRDGTLLRRFDNVDPAHHSDEVLQLVTSLGN